MVYFNRKKKKKKSSYVHIKVMRKSLTIVPLFFRPDSFSLSPSENQHILPLDDLYVPLSDGRIKRNPLHARWLSCPSKAKVDERVLVFDVNASLAPLIFFQRVGVWLRG